MVAKPRAPRSNLPHPRWNARGPRRQATRRTRGPGEPAPKTPHVALAGLLVSLDHAPTTAPNERGDYAIRAPGAGRETKTASVHTPGADDLVPRLCAGEELEPRTATRRLTVLNGRTDVSLRDTPMRLLWRARQDEYRMVQPNRRSTLTPLAIRPPGRAALSAAQESNSRAPRCPRAAPTSRSTSPDHSAPHQRAWSARSARRA
jgi:hypothetical protein